MILDAFLQFTTAANDDWSGTDPTVSGNVIDLHMAGIPVLANLQGARDIGIGDDPALKLLIQVTTAFAGGTSVIVTLQGAPDNGSGLPGSYASWWASPAHTTAQLVVGARLMDMDMPRPPQGVGIPRFLRLAYTNSGTFTAGIIQGYIILDRMDQYYSSTSNAVMGGYPAGVTVAN